METEISTHALTEGDRKDMFCSSVCMNFNSRPHGGRPVAHEVIAGQWGFQLTPSRRATCPLSIFVRRIDFNSRPHGGRRNGERAEIFRQHFNSRPHGGRHLLVILVGVYLIHFNSRPHGGRQHEDSLCDRKIRHFNSRPHGGRP